MNDPIETFEVNENQRVAVYLDEDTPNPRTDYGDGNSHMFYTSPHDRRNYINPDGKGQPNGIGAWDTLAENADGVRGVWDDERGAFRLVRVRPDMEVLPLFERYLRITTGRGVAAEHHSHGYVQGSECDVVVYMDGDDITARGWAHWTDEQIREALVAEADAYGQWARGDVYVVALEKRYHTTWTSSDGDITIQGDDEWMNVESLGGCYLTDEYTALAVAQENFEQYEGPEEAVA